MSLDVGRIHFLELLLDKAMDKRRLYDALESCLEALEHGMDMDAALAKYPRLAKKLRPLLKTSLRARTLAVASVPELASSHGRMKLAQRLAEMEHRRLSWRTATPLPTIVPSVKHTWNSICLPLFINKHMRQQSSGNPVKKIFVHHKKKDKTPEKNDHMPTHQP